MGYSLQDADLSKIWLKYFELFLRPQGKDTPAVAPRLEMLQLMSERPPCEAWEKLREYLAQNADVLSGWSSSFQPFSGRDQIFRGDANVANLPFERDRVAEIQKTQASVADYLYTDSRCAVAHVDHRPFVDPDNAEH